MHTSIQSIVDPVNPFLEVQPTQTRAAMSAARGRISGAAIAAGLTVVVGAALYPIYFLPSMNTADYGELRGFLGELNTTCSFQAPR